MPLSESPERRESEPAAVEPRAAVPVSTIERMRRIVQTKEAEVMGGLSVDLLTARTVVRVYDRLSERKREKFVLLTPKQMVHKAFELDK